METIATEKHKISDDLLVATKSIIKGLMAAGKQYTAKKVAAEGKITRETIASIEDKEFCKRLESILRQEFSKIGINLKSADDHRIGYFLWFPGCPQIKLFCSYSDLLSRYAGLVFGTGIKFYCCQKDVLKDIIKFAKVESINEYMKKLQQVCAITDSWRIIKWNSKVVIIKDGQFFCVAQMNNILELGKQLVFLGLNRLDWITLSKFFDGVKLVSTRYDEKEFWTKLGRNLDFAV